MQLMPYQAILQALSDNDIAKMQEGRETCLAILTHRPNHLVCLELIGEIDLATGHLEEAEKWFAKALTIQPDSPELEFNYSLTLARQGKYPEALAVLTPRANANPYHAETFFHLGIIYELAGQISDATTAYQTARQLAPDDTDILHHLGTALMNADNLAEAENCFRHILTIDPNDEFALNNLGNILYCQGEFNHSIDLYQQALTIQPDFPPALGNLATALDSAGLLPEAIAIFRKTIALYPEYREFQVNLSTALLADGQLDEGWREFEKRTDLFPLFAARQKIKKPLWHGETGSGQTLLIRAEQGYGDTIQFCRYAPLAAERGFRVVLEVQPPLVKLLHSLPGVQQVIAYDDSLPEVDCYCPMMSLPHAFHTQLETIPCKIPYLTVPEESRHKWKQRMPVSEPGTIKVGLVWAGKHRDASLELAATGRRRSIDPALFAPLIAIPGIQFYSLQKIGPDAPKEFSLIDLMDECKDFADTAALIMNLDLIISVDTAVAHLAGALGKKVWLLNRFDSCWRWLRTRGDTPWYPTMRLFRQTESNDWPSVIEAVRNELEQATPSD